MPCIVKVVLSFISGNVNSIVVNDSTYASRGTPEMPSECPDLPLCMPLHRSIQNGLVPVDGDVFVSLEDRGPVFSVVRFDAHNDHKRARVDIDVDNMRSEASFYKKRPS